MCKVYFQTFSIKKWCVKSVPSDLVTGEALCDEKPHRSPALGRTKLRFTDPRNIERGLLAFEAIRKDLYSSRIWRKRLTTIEQNEKQQPSL